MRTVSCVLPAIALLVAAVSCQFPAPTPTGVLKWAKSSTSGTGGAPAVGDDGTVFFPKGAELSALRPDGAYRWSLATAALRSDPAIGPDGTVYVVEADSQYRLIAVADTGQLKWKHHVLGHVPAYRPGLAVGPDGTVYVAADTLLLAVNPDSTLQWSLGLSCAAKFAPVIDAAGNVYVASETLLTSVSRLGVLQWRYAFQNRVSQPVSVGLNDVILVTTWDFADSSFLNAVNQDASLAWRFRLAGKAGEPVIGADNAVRIAGGAKLHLVAPDGSAQQLDSVSAASPAVRDNGSVVAAQSGGAFIFTTYAGMDCYAPNGDVLWTYRSHSDDSGALPPAVGPDGTIYFATWGGTLYAMKDSGTVANCRWPMYQHDAKHTGRAGP